MSLIIDTGILIEIENGNKEVIEAIEKLKDAPKSDLFITFFTFCEFYCGIVNKSEKNKTKATERLAQYKLLNTTKTTGIIFSETLHKIRKKGGSSIPLFDTMIGAIGDGAQHGACNS